jgi:signal transduction histidine kinase
MSDRSANYGRDGFAERILELRNEGKLQEAVSLCDEAQRVYPESYFYKKISGDLRFQTEDYEQAAACFLQFVRLIPQSQKAFTEFAKRYYRLHRVWPKDRMAKYAAEIMSEIKSGIIQGQTAASCRALIERDVPKEIELTELGHKLVQAIADDSSFGEVVSLTKALESSNPAELAFISDRYILKRRRTQRTIRIDTYFISTNERMKRYESALDIAEELLALRLDSVVIRSMFRICRGLGHYERADRVLNKYPEILKRSDFNILYELVYYHEAHDDMDQVQATLRRIDATSPTSLPIQKTLRNFYIRFGLIEDAERIEPTILALSRERPMTLKAEKYSDEVQESELGVGSKMRELYSQLEHHKRLAAISDLTTGISHELGQPITNIRYTVQFYRRAFEGSLTKELVLKVFDSILEETERMGGLIKRLAPLTSSRSVVEEFDILDRIHKRVQAEAVRLRRAGISVIIYPKRDAGISMVGDPVKFDQMISNLLLNSIDAIKERRRPGKNRIEIAVRDEQDRVNISFADNGVGIPAKNRGKVFDPFFSTKSPGKGEGLGLFIVWNILKMQGGRIRIDPNYKDGARFFIDVPKVTYIPKEVAV